MPADQDSIAEVGDRQPPHHTHHHLVRQDAHGAVGVGVHPGNILIYVADQGLDWDRTAEWSERPGRNLFPLSISTVLPAAWLLSPANTTQTQMTLCIREGFQTFIANIRYV